MLQLGAGNKQDADSGDKQTYPLQFTLPFLEKQPTDKCQKENLEAV